MAIEISMADARLTQLLSAVNAAGKSIQGCTAEILKERKGGRCVEIWEWLLTDVIKRYDERGTVAGDHIVALFHVAHDVILGSRNRARTEPGGSVPAMSIKGAEEWARVFGSSLLRMIPMAIDCARRNNNDKLVCPTATVDGAALRGPDVRAGRVIPRRHASLTAAPSRAPRQLRCAA